MNLNLHILKEDLEEWDFQGTLLSPGIERGCGYPLLCSSCPESFREGIVYILTAACLPEKPKVTPKCSILCIGEPPVGWMDRTCDFLYTLSDRSVHELMNDVCQRFYFYQQWEDRMQEAVDLQLPPQELAVRSADVFHNTIYAQGSFFRVLCKYVPPLDESIEFFRAYKKDYDSFQLGGTLKAEDISLMISDAEYLNCIYSTEPAIYSGELYGYRILYYNIFIENTFVARIGIDEILSPIQQRDHALITVLGHYLKKRLMNSEVYDFERPREMDEILQNLLSHRLLPEEKIYQFLSGYRWDINDTYVCFILKMKTEDASTALEPLALQLARIIMQDCYAVKDDMIVFVCNLTKLNTTRDRLYATILPFLRDNLLTAGISTTYRDFKNLYYYYQQAIIAESIGQKANPMHWYFKFEEYQLEYMLRKCTEKTIPEVLIPEGLKALMEYDRLKKHNYTETLRLYLTHDRNIAETIRAAYMHRNTFLYQIQRIQEIIQMDLNDPDVRLLLLMAFRILESAPKAKE